MNCRINDNDVDEMMDDDDDNDNSKFHIDGIFCVLAKAFGCVNHEILIMKLQYDGLQEQNINWFKSYLTNRNRE
jgi:hypothetical protein